MATYRTSLQTDSNVICTLLLFKNVKNSSNIRKQLLQGNIKGSLIKPSLILDTFQVLVAVNKAVHCQKNGRLATKSVYTEIIYNLSPNKSIGESLKGFGIGDNDDSILAVLVGDAGSEENIKHLMTEVQGDVVDISQLQELTDERLIKQVYKIKEPELQVGSLLDAVVGFIATKEFGRA